MGSDSGLVGQRDAHAYSASKGAVINLTRAMAISYGIHGIRVNYVCPSLVKTPMTQTKLNEGETWEERAKEWAQMFPLRRLGRPMDIAYRCLYLASNEVVMGHRYDFSDRWRNNSTIMKLMYNKRDSI